MICKKGPMLEWNQGCWCYMRLAVGLQQTVSEHVLRVLMSEYITRDNPYNNNPVAN